MIVTPKNKHPADGPVVVCSSVVVVVVEIRFWRLLFLCVCACTLRGGVVGQNHPSQQEQGEVSTS
jgi:hypothetical protein